MRLILPLLALCAGDLVSVIALRQPTSQGRRLLAAFLPAVLVSLCLLAWEPYWLWALLSVSFAAALTAARLGAVALERAAGGAAFWRVTLLRLSPVLLLALYAAIPARPSGWGLLVERACSGIGDAETRWAVSLAALLFLLNILPVGALIRRVLAKMGFGPAADRPDSGFVIGVLERVCILTLALLGQYTAVSFVIAAKSLARFKMLEERSFAEKYLAGTLMSLAAAVGSGALFHLLTGTN